MDGATLKFLYGNYRNGQHHLNGAFTAGSAYQAFNVLTDYASSKI